MAERQRGEVAAWIVAAILVVLLVASLTGAGTLMGGIGMAWMILLPLALIGGVAYLAYRSGQEAAKP